MKLQGYQVENPRGNRIFWSLKTIAALRVVFIGPVIVHIIKKDKVTG